MQLLLTASVLAQALTVLKTRSNEATTTADTTESDNTNASTKIVAALWTLFDQLASDPAFWTTLSAPDVAFICSSLARAPGSRALLVVLAVLSKLLELVERGSVSFDEFVRPHLDVVRQGVLRFLQSKWPHQERDACLELVQSLMALAGPSWLLASESTDAPEASAATPEATSVAGAAVPGSKFLLVVVKLVAIEVRLSIS